jgi:hypothetical protein
MALPTSTPGIQYVRRPSLIVMQAHLITHYSRHLIGFAQQVPNKSAGCPISSKTSVCRLALLRVS